MNKTRTNIGIIHDVPSCLPGNNMRIYVANSIWTSRLAVVAVYIVNGQSVLSLITMPYPVLAWIEYFLLQNTAR